MVNPTQWLNMPIRHFSPTEVLYRLVKHSITVTQTHNTVAQYANQTLCFKKAQKNYSTYPSDTLLHHAQGKIHYGASLEPDFILSEFAIHSWIAADNIESSFQFSQKWAKLIVGLLRNRTAFRNISSEGVCSTCLCRMPSLIERVSCIFVSFFFFSMA